MLFNSYSYLIFLPLSIIGYYLVPERYSRHFLLACSFFFYLSWNPIYGTLLLATLISTWFGAKLLETHRNVLKRRFVFFFSISISLFLLFLFKYADFVLGLITKFLYLFRIDTGSPALNLILPVGISFYTFQAVGYVIDVYRGDIPAEQSFITYALFVSFFPQLVAGPIERSKNLISQLQHRHRPDSSMVKEGIYLLLWGFFLKIVLADRLAIFVDTVYGNVDAYPGCYLIVATIFFAFQIYCDFYGYSSIAVGSAALLGIRLMENFDCPYLQSSVASFWRHWHISLNAWFRDYLYIPLGGNRKGRSRQMINTLIVFAVSGLWHGANLTFVIWGILNGLYQISSRLTAGIRTSVRTVLHIPGNTLGSRIFGTVVTFFLICFSWIFFRANDLNHVKVIFKSLLVYNPWILFTGGLEGCGLDAKELLLAFICLLVLFASDLAKKQGIIIRQVLLRQSWLFQAFMIAFSVTFIMVFGLYGPQFHAENFIYFQF